MFVKIGTLTKSTITPCTYKRPFFEMYDLPMFHSMVFLDKTEATNVAFKRSLPLVLGANVRHEIVPPSKSSGTLAACVRSIRGDGVVMGSEMMGLDTRRHVVDIADGKTLTGVPYLRLAFGDSGDGVRCGCGCGCRWIGAIEVSKTCDERVLNSGARRGDCRESGM